MSAAGSQGSRARALRRALYAAGFFNVLGAGLFAFPALGLGPLAGLPAEVPVVYRAFTALFVLLFGGAYVYLASQPKIQKPFVAFGAIGKTTAFVAAVVLWLGQDLSAFGVLLLGGDFAFAAFFAWCLVGIDASEAA
ncbi:MAG TPA: hypothetical protein VJM11_18020 [Nevskiaceae bacterium]|nr:hypothetical protein [Nevskiaceae bacterium]